MNETNKKPNPEHNYSHLDINTYCFSFNSHCFSVPILPVKIKLKIEKTNKKIFIKKVNFSPGGPWIKYDRNKEEKITL